MLLLKKLSQGHIYPQITQAPISNYADFLNYFRGGHTIDDNLGATVIANTPQARMLDTAIASRHLTKTKCMAIPDEFLADVTLTKSGSELIQGFFDRQFCEMAVAEARKSVAEDKRLHPHVGAVVVKDGNVLSTGYRGENGKGDHAEYSAMQKLNKADLEGCTVYTTLAPCSIRKLPKTPCTNHLIDSKVKRVVYGMPDKDESVFGHHSLIEAEIEIALFPDDLVKELLALNKKWSDSLRVKPIVSPNDTPSLASVSYYKLGTSMADNTHFFVRPPWTEGGFFTVEDALRNVLAYGRTIEDIAIEWRNMDTKKRIAEKLVRQSVGSSDQRLNLT
jgi:pyrimidine deaminase RibD-like protein